MIPELKELPYETRLHSLNFQTLEMRRIRGDLIEVFKIMDGFERLHWKLLFTPAVYEGTRGHSMNLQKETVRLNVRKHFFIQRVINYWNALLQSTVSANSINGFKDQLKIHLQHVIEGGGGVTQAISFLSLTQSSTSGIQ